METLVANKSSKIIDKLVSLSKQNDHDVFNDIEWPDAIESGNYWMSPALSSVDGVELKEALSEEQLKELSIDTILKTS